MEEKKNVQNNLPTEIVQNIFQSLPAYNRFGKTTNVDDVLQCCLVCKNWKIAAQRILYSHVTLYCKYDLHKFHLGTVDNNQSPLNYVKKLSFRFTLQERVLKALSLKLHFVEHLSIPDPGADIYRTLIIISLKIYPSLKTSRTLETKPKTDVTLIDLSKTMPKKISAS